MDESHLDQIHGVLGCFDRMLFRGYLPIQWGGGMAEFLLKETERPEGRPRLKPGTQNALSFR